MSLKNLSLLTGATLVAPTGGSAMPFLSIGSNADNPDTLYCTSDTDFRTQRTVDVSVKRPKVSATAPNGYTQARATAVFKFPLELENGNITVTQLN